MIDAPLCIVELVDSSINFQHYRRMLDDPDVGAHAWFYGVTRRSTAVAPREPGEPGESCEVGKRSGPTEAMKITQSLSYEAHRSMAIKQLELLVANAAERFRLTAIVAVHRLGAVPIGEASVIIGCSSPHRRAVFEALPWVMDQLKQVVPIWKQETYADGTTEWVHPIEPPAAEPKAAPSSSQK